MLLLSKRSRDLLVILLTCLANDAKAAPASDPSTWFELSWDGGETCLSPTELQESVEARLGRRVFSGQGAPNTRIAVSFVEQPARTGWQVSVAVAEPDGTIGGERLLATPTVDCHALDDPLILAVALMVDSELMRAQARRAPQNQRPAPAAPIHRDVGRPQAPVETAPRFTAWRRQKLKWNGAVQLGPAIGLGLLPNVAWGGRVTGSVSVGNLLPLRVRAELFEPQRVDLAPAGHVEFCRFTLGAGLCPTHRMRSYELAACAGLSASVLRASSTGLVVSRQFSRTTPVVDASLGANWFFARRWSLGAESGIGLPLQRPVYLYERAGLADQTVFRMSPVTFTASVTIGATFR
ncbi:MAG TPA: hypothetical protein VK524_05390 [Polyangiaceae bacterium]|nr:hypothetical protein [Polyangiaceae bacterium]